MPGKPKNTRRSNIIETKQKSFQEPPSDEQLNKSVSAKQTNRRLGNNICPVNLQTKPVDPPSDEEFEVEKILDKRVISGKVSNHILLINSFEMCNENKQFVFSIVVRSNIISNLGDIQIRKIYGSQLKV